MPFLTTRGAGSAQGFGFGSSSAAGPVSGDFWIGNQAGQSSVVVGATDISQNIYVLSNTGSARSVTKISSAGVVLWQRSSTNASFNAVAVDSSGNVYCAGSWLISPNSYSYIIKFNSSGTRLWDARQSSISNAFTRIQVDSSGDVFASLNGNYFAKFNGSTGSLIWGRTLSGTSLAIAGLSVDPSGDVYLSGRVTVSSFEQGFLAKVNTSGSLIWNNILSIPSSSNQLNACNASYAGNIYVSGEYSTGGMVALYDSSGSLLWNRVYTRSGGYGNPRFNDVAVSLSNGNAYVAASQFGGGNPVETIVASINLSGVNLWKTNMGITSFSAFARGLAFNTPNNIVFGFADSSGGNYNLNANMPSDGSRLGTYTLNSVPCVYSDAATTTVATGTATSSGGSLTASNSSLSYTSPSGTYTTGVATYTIVDVP